MAHLPTTAAAYPRGGVVAPDPPRGTVRKPVGPADPFRGRIYISQVSRDHQRGSDIRPSGVGYGFLPFDEKVNQTKGGR